MVRIYATDINPYCICTHAHGSHSPRWYWWFIAFSGLVIPLVITFSVDMEIENIFYLVPMMFTMVLLFKNPFVKSLTCLLCACKHFEVDYKNEENILRSKDVFKFKTGGKDYIDTDNEFRE